MGHPLGCTGARQVATALSEAKREKKKIFVTSMCIGSGMVSYPSCDLTLVCLLDWNKLTLDLGNGRCVCQRAIDQME